MSEVIEWTAPKLKRFKKAYAKALSEDKDQFEFEGHSFVRNYAEYLIQFLEALFDKKNP